MHKKWINIVFVVALALAMLPGQAASARANLESKSPGLGFSKSGDFGFAPSGVSQQEWKGIQEQMQRSQYPESLLLRAPTPVINGQFGLSVAVSGDVLVVGAPSESYGGDDYVGAAYVFQRDQNTPSGWGNVQVLRSDDPGAMDRFGLIAAVEGDVIAIGSYQEDGGAGNPYNDAGAVYIFERNQGGTNNWGWVATLHASNLAQDAFFGYSIDISGDIMAVGAYHANDGIGGVYVFERGAGGWAQTKMLLPTGGGVSDMFGYSVSISGDVIVAGAIFAGSSYPGLAYVFERNQGGAGNWGQAAVLSASDAQTYDYFGSSVEVSGDVIVVGAPCEDFESSDTNANSGAAYVFERNQGGANHWGEVKKLVAADTKPGILFGEVAAIFGDVILIGAEGAEAAYIFQRDEGGRNAWNQAQKLTASNAEAGDLFGRALGISGDVIVIGAYNEDGAPNNIWGCGAAYVFQRDPGGPWTQVKTNHASDAHASDSFGGAVAVSGDVIVVGASGVNTPASAAGAAYIFQRDQGNSGMWGEIPVILRDPSPLAEDRFGGSVAIFGDVVVVGEAYKDSAGSDAGAAHVFQRNQGGPNNWGHVKTLLATGGVTYDRFGLSVAIYGDVIVVGAPLQDSKASNAGAAYIFERNQGGVDNWGQVKQLTASDGQANDSFGQSVAISEDVIVVGAHQEDSGGDNAGAAYVFLRDQGGADNWGEVKILHASDAEANAEFGYSLATAGDVIVAGAHNHAAYKGAAYVFQRDQGAAGGWNQVQILSSAGLPTGSLFGNSVAVTRDVIAVGAVAYSSPVGATSNAGAVLIFRRNEGGVNAWDQAAVLSASDAQANDYLGSSVSASGDIVVSGAPGEDGGAGNPLPDAGAIYIFQNWEPNNKVFLPLVGK